MGRVGKLSRSNWKREDSLVVALIKNSAVVMGEKTRFSCLIQSVKSLLKGV